MIQSFPLLSRVIIVSIIVSRRKKNDDSYLAIFHDTNSLLGCEERQMRKANTGTIGKMNETSYLTFLVFHQTLVSDCVNSTHISIRVLMRIKDTWKHVAESKYCYAQTKRVMQLRNS